MRLQRAPGSRESDGSGAPDSPSSGLAGSILRASERSALPGTPTPPNEAVEARNGNGRHEPTNEPREPNEPDDSPHEPDA
jgi:hypothetical protein